MKVKLNIKGNISHRVRAPVKYRVSVLWSLMFTSEVKLAESEVISCPFQTSQNYEVIQICSAHRKGVKKKRVNSWRQRMWNLKKRPFF